MRGGCVRRESLSPMSYFKSEWELKSKLSILTIKIRMNPMLPNTKFRLGKLHLGGGMKSVY